MKTYVCAAAGFLVAGLARPAESITEQERISDFDTDDFVFNLGGPEPDAPTDGFQVRAAGLAQFPVVEGQGVSMAVVNIDACTINLPHIHPRAAEMAYVIKGSLRSAFIEENGGDGAIVNDLSEGDVTFYPQGLMHYQQNLECEPATFVAAFSSEDPGSVTITTRFFELPTEAIQATTNLDDPTLTAFLESLPEAPAMARIMCLERCFSSDDEMSFSFAAGGH